jgi:hypothetical protein
MRLLELRGSSTSAESKPAALLQKSATKLTASEHALKRPSTAQTTPTATHIFPINSSHAQSQIRRRPVIDLEQLQQRVDLLEQRIQTRLNKQGDVAWKEELEQLRHCMKLLERKLETELWIAKQREYALLEMLAKPTLITSIKQRLIRILNKTPAAVLHWFKAFGKEWWSDCQPLWWPKFSAAWQEAMFRARR